MKIQAFEWLITATELVFGEADGQGKKEVQEEKYHSLNFWDALYKQHENYLRVLPMLEEHPIIQNILWEIVQAQKVVEFVKMQRKLIQSNSGKFLNEKYYNYVAFKDKQQPEYIEKLIEICAKSRIDILTENAILKDWLKTYETITEQNKSGTLYKSNNFEKIKQIHRNVYLSPLDYGNLFFEISARIETANSIKQDIKHILEENQLQNKELNKQARVRYSRLKTDLNHYERNCEIPGILEIDKVLKQIKNSRETIIECKAVLSEKCETTADQIKQLEKARAIQKNILIDMEAEEHEIRSVMFEKNI